MKEQKKRILKLVEEGRMTAEEALALIEALESDSQKKEEKITALSTAVIGFNNNENTSSYSADKHSSLGAKLMEWVDTAVKKVKEIDLDLNFGKSIDVTHIFQLQSADLKDLDIQLPNGSISLQPWHEQDIRVECHAKVYRAENMEQARDVFLSEIDCLVDGSTFIFHTEKKTMKVNAVIFIPQQTYDQVKIKLFNGPVRGEELNVDTLKVKTANGVISFSAITGNTGEFETGNGQIKLASSRFEKLAAESITGFIQFNGSAEKLDVQSFNGNLDLLLADYACETIYAKTTTGNIQITIPEGSRVAGELKTNLGTLSAELDDLDISSEKNETIQKELRFKTAKDPDLSIFADSKTGSILLK